MGSLRSSGDPSCAFAPLQDPGRTNVPSPLSGTSMLPPLAGRRRLRQCLISGLTRSFGTRCRTLHAGVAAHVQGLLPAGRLAFAGRASNPLDRDERFQLVLTIIPLSCSPDATILRLRFHATAIRSLMNRRRLGGGEWPQRVRPKLGNRESQSAAKSFAIEVKTR